MKTPGLISALSMVSLSLTDPRACSNSAPPDINRSGRRWLAQADDLVQSALQRFASTLIEFAIVAPPIGVVRELQQFDVCLIECDHEFAVGFEFKIEDILLRELGAIEHLHDH